MELLLDMFFSINLLRLRYIYKYIYIYIYIYLFINEMKTLIDSYSVIHFKMIFHSGFKN